MEYSYNITEEKNCRRIIEIEIPKERVAEKFDEIFKMLKKEAKIPGFRPGKAPMSVVKARFARDAVAEVSDTLVEDAYTKIMKETKLSPISNPTVDSGEYSEGEPLKARVTVEIAPDVKLEKITGFTIKKQSETITEADVEAAYNAILDIESSLEPTDGLAAEGDFVMVDLEKTFDPDNRLSKNEFKDFAVELDGRSSLPEYIEALKGTKPGDEKEFTVEYPLDFQSKELRGARIRYKAKVTSLKRKVPPELNDEFYAKFGEDIHTVEEFKTKIRLDLETRRKKEIQEDIREQAIKYVIMYNQFEMPQSLLERYLDDVVEDFKKQYKGEKFDDQEVRERYRTVGIRMIRWNLLMHEIAEKLGLKAEKEDIDKWIEAFADRYNMALEKARLTLEQSRKVNEIRETVLEAKVLSHILDNSEIVDAEQ